jgi:hypothetical protein
MRKEDKSRPYYDALGNFVGYGDRSTIVSRDGEHVDSVIKTLDQSRLLTRNAGCFNCLHWEQGVKFREKVNACFARDVQVYMGKGITRDIAELKAKQVRDEIVKHKSHLGVCGVNAGIDPVRNIVVDFVPATYLCGDPVSGMLVKWAARGGLSLIRDPGEALSPPIAEEYDKRGDVAPIVEEAKRLAAATDDDA